MAPNEFFFTSDGATQLQIIERDGFNNIRISYQNEKHSLSTAETVECSPCRTVVPVELDPGEVWRARTTFRWLPLPIPAVYNSIEYIDRRTDLQKTCPERMIQRRVHS